MATTASVCQRLLARFVSLRLYVWLLSAAAAVEAGWRC